MRKAKWLSKLFIPLLVAVMLTISDKEVVAQVPCSATPDYYSVSMKRMLVLYVGNYINQITQGQLGIDTATLLACHIYRLNRLLPYNAAFDGDQTTTGMVLINSGQILKAKKDLGLLKGDDMMRRLFELGTYYLFKTGSNKSDLDSAKFFNDIAYSLIQANCPRKWLSVCNDFYGKYYARSGDYTKSQLYFLKVNASAAHEKDQHALAESLFTQASYLPYNSPKKLKILQKSLLLSQFLNLNILKLLAADEILTIHFMLGSKEIGEDLKRILEMEKAIGFRHLQYTYNVLAYTVMTTAFYGLQIQYATLSLNSMQATRDFALAPIFYERIAQAYAGSDDHQQAYFWYNKIINGPLSRQSQIFWYQGFLDNVSLMVDDNHYTAALKLMIRINNKFPPQNNLDELTLKLFTADCYYHLGEYTKAETLNRASMSLAQAYPVAFVHTRLGDSYAQMAEIYLAEKKLEDCKEIVQKANQLSPALLNVYTKRRLAHVSFELDSTDRHYAVAIKDYEAYKKLFDSIVNTASINQVIELNVKYETQNKDRDIKFLKQANELQDTKLNEDSYYRKMTFGIIIFISIIAILLYIFYRSKQQSNLRLQSQQKVLENLITEKESLVKEIHHRVKNNLHTIVSLLESQSAYLHNDDALAAVRDSQHRVHAMSLIHQKLYMGDNMTSIKSDEYIKELINYLKDSFNLRNTIQFEIDVEPVILDVSQAIPLGLIINEVITNSIKYAFSEDGGKIIITLKKNDASGCYMLKIEDNGRGLPSDFNVNDRSKSLGMSLIGGLSKEFGGQFYISGDNGTSVSIMFPSFDIFTQGLNEKNK